MCFNLCSNSQTNCPNRTTRTVVTAIGPRGPVGPTGPVGPQGPQGPQGDAGLSNALYALTTNGTLTSGAIAPVAANVATPNNTTTVSGGVLTLQAGYYLVSFFVTGASELKMRTRQKLPKSKTPAEPCVICESGRSATRR